MVGIKISRKPISVIGQSARQSLLQSSPLVPIAQARQFGWDFAHRRTDAPTHRIAVDDVGSPSDSGIGSSSGVELPLRHSGSISNSQIAQQELHATP